MRLISPPDWGCFGIHVAQIASDLVHAHQTVGDGCEVHPVFFPLTAQPAGGGCDQIKKNRFNGNTFGRHESFDMLE